MMLTRLAKFPLVTAYGEFELNAFMFGDNQQVVFALRHAGIEQPDDEMLLRIQYGCITGTAFGARDCDCGLQVAASLKRIAEKPGLFIYFADHEAFGLGLAAKLKISAIEKETGQLFTEVLTDNKINSPTLDVLWTVPHIFREMGIATKVIILGSSEAKAKRLRELGLTVVRSENLEIDERLLSSEALRERVAKRGRR